MCGIVGYLSAEVDGATPIMTMAAAIAHRGPDDEGFVLANLPRRQQYTFASDKSPAPIRDAYPVLRRDDTVPLHHLAMAQVRYSIIDLSSHGHQPMWSLCGQYCISFNGEIYNYIELRDTLKAQGRVFATQSDTEVLLQAYIEWGVHMFERLNGFFFFCLCPLRCASPTSAFRARPDRQSTFISVSWHKGCALGLRDQGADPVGSGQFACS